MADQTAVVERPGSRAKVRYVRMSASKARVVLDLIRGKRVEEALEILEFTERLAADPIAKCLRSAMANAEHNEEIDADDLFVSVCYADEGPTLKRFRPRARGRAGRIHKQTCHITIEVARFTDEELDEERQRNEAKAEGRRKRQSSRGSGGGDRARRVARSRAAAKAEDADAQDQDQDQDGDDADADAEDLVDDAEASAAEVGDDEVGDPEASETDEASADETDETETDADATGGEATDETAADQDPEDPEDDAEVKQ